MFKRLASVVLAVLMAGVLTPALAENLVNPKLLAGPGGAMARSLPSYRFDDPAERQASGQSGQGSSWTTGGKVMFFVGLGLVGEGAVAMIYAQTLKDTSYCTGSGYSRYCYSEDYSTVRLFARGAGGVSIGVGALLIALGLGRRD